MTIYERIKALRLSKKMSQQELAELVGYAGRSAISKVENGERDISQSMIVKYAKALGVTPTYLLYGDNDVAAQPREENDPRYIIFHRDGKTVMAILTDEQRRIFDALISNAEIKED